MFILETNNVKSKIKDQTVTIINTKSASSLL